MIQLVQAEYNIKSGYPIVRRTLEDKKKLIENRVTGLSPVAPPSNTSCAAALAMPLAIAR